MKQTKKALSLLLAALLLLGALSAGSICFAAARGQCGPQMHWILDNNGLLRITGSGRMTDAQTWPDQAAAIKTVQFECVPENIGAGSFENCVNLKTITIPDGVKTIGYGAFYQCTALASVVLPDSIESISNKVFCGCSALQSVAIPAKVTSLGVSLFENCASLQSVTLPQGLTEIGFGAFRGCTALKDVYFGGTRAQWNAIENMGDNAPLDAATVHCSDDNSLADKPFFSRVIDAIRRVFDRLFGWLIRR